MIENLLKIAKAYDNGDQDVHIDQYDDAVEQIDFLAAQGNAQAQDYIDSL